MNNEDLKKYYEILELDSDASREEIAGAYKHLKNLYSKSSLATIPVDNDWNESDKRGILEQVEDAYLKLLLHAREERADELTEDEGPTMTPLDEYQPKEEPVITRDEYHPPEEPAVSIDFDEEEPPKQEPGIKEELFDSFVEEEVLAFDLEEELEVEEPGVEIEVEKEIEKETERETEREIEREIEKEDTQAEKFIGGVDAQPITGAVLKELREKQELGLPDLADSTQVPVEKLEAIEAEAFDTLPEAGYLRYYVTSYARVLGLPDPKDAADQYMKRFREWKKEAGFTVL
ncbi:MAG: helix-turn-helix domain-containing protein [Candidatus Aminicenantes bacterium]|nr:helix-turn-helix domain-containing protein [Candidatus Aminicenantes bacterium]